MFDITWFLAVLSLSGNVFNVKKRVSCFYIWTLIVEQLEKTYTRFSQKSHEMAEFYTNILFAFSSCLTIVKYFGLF